MASAIRHRMYRGPSHGEQVKFEIGQTFSSVKAFRIYLKEYAIQEGVIINRIKNEKLRVTTTCALPNCQWRIHASVLVDKVTFMVRTMSDENHTCDRVVKNPEITSF